MTPAATIADLLNATPKLRVIDLDSHGHPDSIDILSKAFAGGWPNYE